MRKASFKFRWK